MSPQDMALWSIALDGTRFLTRAEKEIMWTPAVLNDGQKSDYGLGWRLITEAGHREVRHRGDWQGFTTHILHLPDDRLTISILMNRSNGQPHVIADKIAALYIPALRKPPEVPPKTALVLSTPIFVRGNMNDWQPVAEMLATEPGVLQARLMLRSGMQEFKIGDAEWKLVDFGARFDETLVKPGRPQRLEFRGEDLFLEIGTPGEYVVRLEIPGREAPLLTVTPVTQLSH